MNGIYKSLNDHLVNILQKEIFLLNSLAYFSYLFSSNESIKRTIFWDIREIILF